LPQKSSWFSKREYQEAGENCALKPLLFPLFANIWAFKSRRVGWTGYGDMRCHQFLSRRLAKEEITWKSIGGRIILKWKLEKLNWTEFRGSDCSKITFFFL
jgi:hypothetical protein